VPWFHGHDRHERIAQALRRDSFDALLALTPENAAYLTGQTSLIASLWRVPGLASAVVGPGDRRAVAVGDAEVESYPAERYSRFSFPLWIERLDLRGSSEGDLRAQIAAARASAVVTRPAQYDLDRVFDAVVAAVRAVALTARRIGADLATVPPSSLQRLLSRLSGVEVLDASATFDDLRAVKDEDEIACLRLAAELTEVGIAAVRDAIRPGLTPLGVTATYQIAIWNRAAGDERFAALRDVEGLAAVGLGNAPASSTVEPGRTVKLDMQVDVGGYHSDVGRTYALAPTPEQCAVYTALRSALAAAEAIVQPGARLCDVFTAGTRAMRDAGFGSYSRGHLGHSVGLAHNYEEPPFIAPDEERPLVPGMVISLELPYYLNGIGAFQLERMLLITPDGHEALDRLPFELAVDRP
jgi:Xaa-Pro dipeptidase